MLAVCRVGGGRRAGGQPLAEEAEDSEEAVEAEAVCNPMDFCEVSAWRDFLSLARESREGGAACRPPLQRRARLVDPEIDARLFTVDELLLLSPEATVHMGVGGSSGSACAASASACASASASATRALTSKAAFLTPWLSRQRAATDGHGASHGPGHVGVGEGARALRALLARGERSASGISAGDGEGEEGEEGAIAPEGQEAPQRSKALKAPLDGIFSSGPLFVLRPREAYSRPEAVASALTAQMQQQDVLGGAGRGEAGVSRGRSALGGLGGVGAAAPHVAGLLSVGHVEGSRRVEVRVHLPPYGGEDENEVVVTVPMRTRVADLRDEAVRQLQRAGVAVLAGAKYELRLYDEDEQEPDYDCPPFDENLQLGCLNVGELALCPVGGPSSSPLGTSPLDAFHAEAAAAPSSTSSASAGPASFASFAGAAGTAGATGYAVGAGARSGVTGGSPLRHESNGSSAQLAAHAELLDSGVLETSGGLGQSANVVSQGWTDGDAAVGGHWAWKGERLPRKVVDFHDGSATPPPPRHAIAGHRRCHSTPPSVEAAKKADVDVDAKAASPLPTLRALAATQSVGSDPAAVAAAGGGSGDGPGQGQGQGPGNVAGAAAPWHHGDVLSHLPAGGQEWQQDTAIRRPPPTAFFFNEYTASIATEYFVTVGVRGSKARPALCAMVVDRDRLYHRALRDPNSQGPQPSAEEPEVQIKRRSSFMSPLLRKLGKRHLRHPSAEAEDSVLADRRVCDVRCISYEESRQRAFVLVFAGARYWGGEKENPSSRAGASATGSPPAPHLELVYEAQTPTECAEIVARLQFLQTLVI